MPNENEVEQDEDGTSGEMPDAAPQTGEDAESIEYMEGAEEVSSELPSTEEDTQENAAPDEDAVDAETDEEACEDDSDEDQGIAEEDGENEPAEDGEEQSPLPLLSVVEAVLFAAREPLKPAQIARAVGGRTRQEVVKTAMDELNVHYLETGRAFEIAEVSGRYQLMSRPEFAPHIMKIHPKRELTGEKEKSQRLTPAAMDTLAIIAYKQPVTRADIEHIRGVGCGPVLKALMERDSIRIVGKRLDMLGQPLVYGTTDSFLVEFGLGSLDELPMRNDFLAILGEEATPMEVAPLVEEEKDSPPTESGQSAEEAGEKTGPNENSEVVDEDEADDATVADDSSEDNGEMNDDDEDDPGENTEAADESDPDKNIDAYDDLDDDGEPEEDEAVSEAENETEEKYPF